jgi:hypothetical protein
MTLQEYNAHPGISASAIKAGRASMMQMRHAMITPRDSTPPTPAMRWGTLAHLALLQPAELAGHTMVWDRPESKATNAYKAFKAEAIAAGKIIVDADELDMLNGMQAAARANADARFFISKVEAVETPMTWTRSDIGACKGRPDCIGAGFLGDYKTTKDIDPRALFGQFHRLGYLHQMAWYMDGFEAASGRQVHSCLILAQQSIPPYECGVIEIPIKQLVATLGASGDVGNEDTCLAIARRYRACEALGSYPGRYAGVTEYVPPAWTLGGADFDPNEAEEN